MTYFATPHTRNRAQGQGSRPRRRPVRALLAVVGIAALGVSGAMTASAATTTAWAEWAPLSGSGGAYTTAVSFAGQPSLTATVTSDSRAGQVGVISGASTWLSEGTPIGAKYGSSRDLPYLNLRPKADSASAPSTTTYTFASPTPSSGWAFALGDIDADAVRIHGTTAAGAPITAADLGFQGGFNYCAPGIAGKPSCTGAADDVPAWDPVALTLTGNAGAVDTFGSAAWFEPTTPLSTLTFEFTRRSGFPIYQTWFAVLARDITGTVVDVDSGPLDGIAVTLTDANGDVIATTTTAAGGTYAFPGNIATDGYTVTATPPAGKEAVIGSGTADLRTEDAVVDLSMRDVAPVTETLSGRVTAAGTGVAGVAVTAVGPTGTLTTVTDDSGNYSFPELTSGEYTISIEVPEGTVPVGATTRTETVASEDVTGVDFALARLGSVSGVVEDSKGTPLGGVSLTIDGPDGDRTVTSEDDGTYVADELVPGAYTITATAPDGYTVAEPAELAVTITGSGEVIVDQDFTLIPVTTTPTPTPSAPGAVGPGGQPGDSGLATTGGANPAPFVAAAGVLLAIGAFLLTRTRRRARD
ncbi:carboxypeptidase regulatory-like domain-containing protein [Microbacterium sp. LTA6]|uniref:MSCRAMM family protein n=1 Tax=unclassified Microbacterium TaxID=2609290 RepID=UPI0031388B02